VQLLQGDTAVVVLLLSTSLLLLLLCVDIITYILLHFETRCILYNHTVGMVEMLWSILMVANGTCQENYSMMAKLVSI
jgi:hypothetical protein